MSRGGGTGRKIGVLSRRIFKVFCVPFFFWHNELPLTEEPIRSSGQDSRILFSMRNERRGRGGRGGRGRGGVGGEGGGRKRGKERVLVVIPYCALFQEGVGEGEGKGERERCA
ncbi:hypothetical protein E2C01_064195 [Portunus trituberculatus]|uniref:Uncharacterized protein n=1 Tax=Portunus trituberculatus TaxID=210409 RepID=A0A5B7HFM2_PORTR|nr:hypothetical protein [Portunus trituberculatus]